MPNSEKAYLIENAQESAKFFEIRITIKLFGVTIIDYTYPPSKN